MRNALQFRAQNLAFSRWYSDCNSVLLWL